jgi:sulfite reductase alpha subunit-like flavoprotein
VTNKDKTKKIECNIFVKDSMFELPNAVNIPLIMVGPGTGIVPFIGFIEQRQELFNLQQDQDELEDLKSKLGESRLYFGCRRPNSDYIFKRFLEKAVSNGAISSLHVAFSKSMNVLKS